MLQKPRPINTQQLPKESVRRAARRYIAKRGWKPLPVNRGRKGPTQEGWPEWKVGDADDYIRQHFSNIALPNVAIQLGKMSGGLTDVDLDCREAVRLAPEFLPETQAVFGRKSKPRAHHLYITDLHETESKAAIPFAENKALNEKETMLVELRVGAGSKGAATLMPPSIHPTGQAIEWDVDGDPAEVSGDELLQKVSLLAAATLLARHYPSGGSRHRAALVLGGLLARAKWRADDIAWFVQSIANVAGDEESEERYRRSCRGQPDGSCHYQSCPWIFSSILAVAISQQALRK